MCNFAMYKFNLTMKRIITFLLIAVGIFSTNTIVASTENITITLTQEDYGIKDIPQKGHRSAPAPVFCVVNFTEYTIETSIPTGITLYEIRDEEGENIIASCTDDNDMVEHLLHLTGTYQFRLVTDTYTYVGYITL